MSTLSPNRLVILSDFAAVRGGASGLALRQAELMAGRGLNVTLIAGDSHQNAPERVDLVSLGGAKLLEAGAFQAATRGIWDRTVQLRVAHWIAQNDDNSTIYHLHGLQQTLSPAVLAPLSRVADRLVIHAHDYFLACPNGAFFDYQSGKTCARRALSFGCIACHCDKTSRAQKLWRVTRQAVQNRGIRALLPEARVILPRAEMADWLRLDGDLIALANPAEAFDLPKLSPSQRQGFVYLGDLNRYKGVYLLAEAARQANVPLTLIGDGAEREALARHFPELRITGWKDRQGIARKLGLARALVAPSLGPEPFGLAPIEALLSGLPVILSDSMLIAAEITRRGGGMSFPAGDAAALAALLGDLSVNSQRIQQLSLKSRAAGQAISLPIQKWIDALLALYSGILGQSRLRRRNYTELLTAAE